LIWKWEWKRKWQWQWQWKWEELDHEFKVADDLCHECRWRVSAQARQTCVAGARWRSLEAYESDERGGC
jgi:hypothetical protein